MTTPMTPTADPSELEARLSMPLAEAMRTQRAVRRLTDDPVDDAVVLRLLELAQKAPSGGDRQPQRYIIVRDPAVKAQLAHLNHQAWSSYRRAAVAAARTGKQRRTLAACDWQAEHFGEFPVLLVVCAQGRARLWPPVAASSQYGSVYPSVQNLLLAARAVGLGAVLTTLPLWSTVRARRILGLPRSVQPVCVVPLGWPQGRYGPTSRKPVEKLVHVDRYGNSPFPAAD